MRNFELTRKRVGLSLVIFSIATGLFALAVVHESSVPRSAEYVFVGFVLGTVFAQTTLAAAWATLGPGRFILRLVLSIAWIVSIGFAFLLSIRPGPGGKGEYEVALTITACLFAQWLLVQILLWGLRLGYDVYLSDGENSVGNTGSRTRQFGIRQLMVFTAIVAVLLAIGRVVVPVLAGSFGRDWNELVIFGAMAIAAVLVTLSLLLAVLLPRYALAITPIVALLIGMSTGLELSLITQLSSRVSGPGFGHVAATNIFQAVWIILIAGLMRTSGYVLRNSEGSQAAG